MHAAQDKSNRPPHRRSFLEWLTYSLGAVAAVVVGAPVVGYFLGVPKREVIWCDLGPGDDFPLGETRLTAFQNPLGQPWDGYTAQNEVFVRNLGGDNFMVLSVNCAHLGCPVQWFPQSGLFMCPCHGGVYNSEGDHASGPPPRGLYHCEWRVRDGHLEVQAPHYPTLQDTLKKA